MSLPRSSDGQDLPILKVYDVVDDFIHFVLCQKSNYILRNLSTIIQTGLRQFNPNIIGYKTVLDRTKNIRSPKMMGKDPATNDATSDDAEGPLSKP
jgi:hypothetical protein